MPLSDVAQGDPHVAAHNAERHLINNIQDLSDPTFSSELSASTDATIAAKRGAASGLASLDGSTKVPETQIPDTIARRADLADVIGAASVTQRSRKQTLITNFQSGHGWTSQGTGGTTSLNYTSDGYAGMAQCVRITTTGTGVGQSVQKLAATAIDLSSKVIELDVKVPSGGYANLSQIRILIGDSSLANNRILIPLDGAAANRAVRADEWFPLRFTMAEVAGAATGTPNLAAITDIRIEIRDKNAAAGTEVLLGKLSFYTPPTPTTPMVVLWFDDAYTSHYSFVRPELAKRNLTAVFAPILDKLETGGSGYTWAQAREMREVNGFEIAPHATSVYNHDNFETLTSDQLVDEFTQIKGRTTANALGGCDHFALPHGYSTPTIDTVGGGFWSTMRTVAALPVDTVPYASRNRLRCLGTTNSTSSSSVLAQIDKLAAGNVQHIYFHDIVAATADTSTKMLQSTLTAILDGLATRVAAGTHLVGNATDAWQAGMNA